MRQDSYVLEDIERDMAQTSEVQAASEELMKQLRIEYIPLYIVLFKKIPRLSNLSPVISAFVVSCLFTLLFLLACALSGYTGKVLLTWYFYTPQIFWILAAFTVWDGYVRLKEVIEDFLGTVVSVSQVKLLESALKTLLISRLQLIVGLIWSVVIAVVALWGQRFAPPAMLEAPPVVKGLGLVATTLMMFVAGLGFWYGIMLLHLSRVFSKIGLLRLYAIAPHNTAALRKLGPFFALIGVYFSIQASPGIAAVVALAGQWQSDVLRSLLQIWILFVLPIPVFLFVYPQIQLINMVGNFKVYILQRIEMTIEKLISQPFHTIDQLDIIMKYHDLYEMVRKSGKSLINLDAIVRLISSLVLPLILYAFDNWDKLQQITGMVKK